MRSFSQIVSVTAVTVLSVAVYVYLVLCYLVLWPQDWITTTII